MLQSRSPETIFSTPQLMRPMRQSRTEPPGPPFLELLNRTFPDTAAPGYWELIEENCGFWAGQIASGPFWQRLRRELPRWSSAYGTFDLVRNVVDPVGKRANRIHSKCVENCRSKSGYRIEWVFDDSVPVPNLKDLVRSRVECAYLDGVSFVTERLEKLAAETGTVYDLEKKGKIDGYYAQHFCFQNDVVFRKGGASVLAKVWCEIQVVTALSTHIREISHRDYSHWREHQESEDEWLWNVDDPRFVTRQLGHLIHLADGLLVRQKNLSTAAQAEDSR